MRGVRTGALRVAGILVMGLLDTEKQIEQMGA